MSLDFQQVRAQVKQMGEHASQRAQHKIDQLQSALDILRQNTNEPERLHQKVELVARNYDANLRCALPVLRPTGCQPEPMDGHFPLPPLPEHATILAADGSQIAPDRHAPINYCLVNVGAIQLHLGEPHAPQISITSQLMYDEALFTPRGILTDARLALIRDINERKCLVDLAEKAAAPVLAFTDGPVELWMGREGEGDDRYYQESLDVYLENLRRLQKLQVIAAGYVDKPGADLVIRLLEVAMTAEDKLVELRNTRPLRPVIDTDLFRKILGPDERSAVFKLQSRSSARYTNGLELHFFYLNVGREGHPWLARIEIPAWVVDNWERVDFLHAALIQQCRVMGSLPYPYVLHRAHEAAVVKLEEKDQVTQMIEMELRQRGVGVGDLSHKQAHKDLPGRTAYGKKASK